MSKKIVFFDIDGTLYDLKLGVPESTKKAIRQLGENGHIPVICTGRARALIPEKLINLGFHGVIGGAGTYVEYQGNLLHNKMDDGTFVKKVLPLLDANNVSYILEGPEYIYYNEKNSLKYEYDIEYIRKTISADKMKLIGSGNMQVNKISCNFPDNLSLIKMIPKLEKEYYLVNHQGSNFLEVLPKGYNKAKGIQRLTQYLGIDRKDTYAFGDSTNDLEMLDYVQYGIAMGNSYPEVLEKAKYKTRSIGEDGIYYGLKDFGLI